jgi:hypothetical protein
VRAALLGRDDADRSLGDFKALEQMRPVALAAPSVGTFDPFSARRMAARGGPA